MRDTVSSKIEKIVQDARDSDKVKVFLGGSCKDNAWRESIQKEFGDYFFFIDPYDEDWDPEDNIYDELAGMVNADYIVFYKGGDLSEREKGFLDNIGRRGELVKEFEDMDKLKAFLKDIKSKKVRLASVSSVLRRCAGDLCKDAFPYTHNQGDLFLEKLDPADKANVVKDLERGVSIIIPEGLPVKPGKKTVGEVVNKYDFDKEEYESFVRPALYKTFPVLEPTLGYDQIKHTYMQKNAKVGVIHSKASTQVDLPEQLALEVMAWGKTNIPDKDLYTKDDKGREDEIHVTLFYGITEDAEDKLRELLSGVKPFECRLGLVTTFKDKKECDVIKIDVESSEMVKLHYLIRESVKNKNEYPTYASHITVAYVKKGKADRVLGDDRFRGATFKVTEIVYSTKDHNKIKIPLGS